MKTVYVLMMYTHYEGADHKTVEVWGTLPTKEDEMDYFRRHSDNGSSGHDGIQVVETVIK